MLAEGSLIIRFLQVSTTVIELVGIVSATALGAEVISEYKIGEDHSPR